MILVALVLQLVPSPLQASSIKYAVFGNSPNQSPKNRLVSVFPPVRQNMSLFVLKRQEKSAVFPQLYKLLSQP
jgi:hypothetical protein